MDVRVTKNFIIIKSLNSESNQYMSILNYECNINLQNKHPSIIVIKDNIPLIQQKNFIGHKNNFFFFNNDYNTVDYLDLTNLSKSNLKEMV